MSSIAPLPSALRIDVPRLPSGVYTALKDTYGDLLEAGNDVSLQWIANQSWIYSTSFNSHELGHDSHANLTLHGIDTVSKVHFNGELLGETDNMFVRYSFTIGHLLLPSPSQNILEIEILSPLQEASKRARELEDLGVVTGPISCPRARGDVECHRNHLRKMQMSFGGEWNPAALSLGIWKPVVVEYYAVAVFRDVEVAIKRNDSHWSMDCRAFLSTHTSQDFYAQLVVYAKDLDYNVSPCFLVLILLKVEIGKTFFFRVNGHPIFMKGANYVPAHTLPELSADADAVTYLLKAAHEANMNMIRVWGGGLYESDTFYNLADFYGLLVWQDLAFSQAAFPLANDFVASVCVEIVQNAQRLSYHPSLALIVTNNEIKLFLANNKSDFGENATRTESDYKAFFIDTIIPKLKVISRKDFSRRPDPVASTPSLGDQESGKNLSDNPQSLNYGDVHFWDDKGFSPETYPHARFVSEFGYASLPIKSTWQRALGDSADDGDHEIARLIRSRQHDPKGFNPILQLIAYHLPFFPQNWDENIDKFIYFSQVAQAMATKTAMEVFRSLRTGNHTMGALIWQLNDVWVAPTWSCIDFYGNPKLLYYWAEELLAPTSVIALYDNNSYNLNITLTREDFSEQRDSQLYYVLVNTYLWTDLIAKKTVARAFVLGSNSLELRQIPLEYLLYEKHLKEELFLEIILEDEYGTSVARNFFYPVTFKNIIGIKDPELTLEVTGQDCKAATYPYANSFSLRITVRYPALLVYLQLSHPNYVKERHKFSANGFTQTQPQKTIHLVFESDLECMTLTTDHIKVQTINQYLI
ncbi:beta-mannosidase [Drosophila erecta]|uniref:beta-mannosidase n=1 Tax=Drosophila erecta TaxID=7220 RepID=UPI000F070FEE|nr:beta-mannosidase [Drosophila erecta]